MKNGNLDVEKVFEKAFIDITFKMTGLEVKRKETFYEITNPKCSFLLRTRGNLRTTITVHFEKRMIPKITQSILKKKDELSEQEQIFYVEEYLNIICGRAISEINTLTGEHSRISLVVLQGEEQEESSEEALKMSYTNIEGDFNVIISYR